MGVRDLGGGVDGGVGQRVPIEVVRELVDSFGAYGRGHREAVAMLARGATLGDLVRETALPRRLVEQVVAALGAELVAEGESLRIRDERVGEYRTMFDAGQLAATRLGLPGEARLQDVPGLFRDIERIVAEAPRPRKALDHVPATPETAVRRAVWMDGTYDIAGATMLCIGDHDLTAVVTCLLNPATRAVVVDIDEDLLGYIDQVAAERGLRIETAYADFRAGLPEVAQGCADLVFTDPPYTPDGVRLFLARGLQGLRDRENGRLLMAYGYGTHHPGLGYNVQQAVGELSLVYEAILPHFNRYVGAQAVGSASDLYVCRPTARTWKLLDRVATSAVNIYTHGTQSVEAGDGRGNSSVADAVLAAARGAAGFNKAVDDDVDGKDTASAARDDEGAPDSDALHVGATMFLPGSGAADLPLGAVLDGSAQASIKKPRTTAVAADLSDDPGTWLYRVLLGVRARRLALAVPNKHPDITDQAAQETLRDDFAGKWTLTFRRSTPDSKHAIVVADAATGYGQADDTERGRRGDRPGHDTQGVRGREDPARVARRLVLGGASRKLENAWRDALVKAARSGTRSVGKSEARELVVAGAASGGLPPEVLERSLVSLPRRRIRAVLSAVADSARAAVVEAAGSGDGPAGADRPTAAP